MTTANLPATSSDAVTLLDDAPVSDGAAPACGACRHPLAAHDALGLRFCAATESSQLSRGCICR